MTICLIPCLLITNLQAESDGKCVSPINTLNIDNVWAGTTVGYDAIENQAYIYIAYYDAERWLTIAQYNKCSGNLEKVRLPSQFDGWDAHNYLTMAFDLDGNLHVAGNMHASNLIYAHTDQPDQLMQLSILRSMTGELEQRITYPKFIKFTDGGLGFMYRHGGSGNGVEIINRYENRQWQRWLDQPLFASDSNTQPVNAYHTGFVRGQDGYFHIAWVWRSNKNVETNFNVNYAKSPDLKTWFNSQGDALTLPITPQSNVMVDLIAPETGLFNNIKLGFDLNHHPVISYIKFDDNGYSQLYHARLEENDWKISSSTHWTYRWEPRGGGTIPAKIYFTGVSIQKGQATEYVFHPDYGSQYFEYDETLNIKQAIANPSNANKQNQDSTDMVTHSQIVKSSNSQDNTKSNYEITWQSMPANNRDMSRECQLNQCNLTTTITLTSNN